MSDIYFARILVVSNYCRVMEYCFTYYFLMNFCRHGSYRFGKFWKGRFFQNGHGKVLDLCLGSSRIS